jgi:hypothetical protein
MTRLLRRIASPLLDPTFHMIAIAAVVGLISAVFPEGPP